jgi:hypothetical protein
MHARACGRAVLPVSRSNALAGQQAARPARASQCRAGTAPARPGPLSGAAVALTFLALQALECSLPNAQMPHARAVLNSPNAQIARSVDAALRRATPAFNADIKQVQARLEDVQFQLRIPQRKPWGAMAKDVREAQGLANVSSKMLSNVPAGKEEDARALVANLLARLDRLQFSIDRKDPDKTSLAALSALQAVSDLELLQVRARSRLSELHVSWRAAHAMAWRGGQQGASQ